MVQYPQCGQRIGDISCFKGANMPATNYAAFYVGKLPVEVKDGVMHFTHFKVRRFKGAERLKFFTDNSSKNRYLVGQKQIGILLVKIGVYDEISETWDEFSADALPPTVIADLDEANEDAILEGILACGFGYGSEAEWKESTEFKRLSGLEQT
jgi:hypothetical protein